jgi:cyclophilin family peptidyl-prolyl cis-trans isomerase
MQNQAGEAPNGTAFVITRGPAPELDTTNLVVARVVGGFETLERISQVPIFKNNESSLFFQCVPWPLSTTHPTCPSYRHPDTQFWTSDQADYSSCSTRLQVLQLSL